jgi:phosphatidate cytidylyltransferase
MAASNLTLRLASAAVAIPLLFLLLFMGEPWWWLAFLHVIALVGAFEMFGMTHPGDNVARGCGVALAWAVMDCFWFGAQYDMRILLTAMAVLPFASIVLTLWRLGDIKSSALHVAAATFGPMWLGGGLGAIALVRVKGGDFGAAYVVFVLGLAWISDTGGYFAGRAFGKNKLYERVSPKKTVEGAIGGVAATVAFAVAIRFIVLQALTIRDAVILGAVGSVIGMLGDLGESLLKRSTGVKDSGGIVPGHGGILDRIDAVLITGPLVLIYLLWQS